MRILKFELPLYGDINIYTGTRPIFLLVDFQNNVPRIWVEAEIGNREVTKLFVQLTGQEVPPDSTHVGSAQANSGTDYYVIHVYRLGKAEFIREMSLV